ncbi:Gfo/Idh/MocA family protein [Massilicoli timonensis]|uniref:Gfo/Idh/MocA family protein n=1 Tax=Massilicoli timonensis TaxID=2015901 RepID=UPI003AB0E14E
MKTIAVLGAGQRGQYAYSDYLKKYADQVKIVAVCEIDDYRRSRMKEMHGISEENVFADADAFFAKGKLADALILATMDETHYTYTMKALDLGYDILLEKPISPKKEECIAMVEKANACGRLLMICHVLRYTTFFRKIKEIIDSGKIGDIVSIQHNENVGIYHMAHSFVRGNWRNSDETSSIILQKSCHDLDILTYLVDSKVKSISSVGALAYFNEEHAPKGSAKRCVDCKVVCIFDARKAYLPCIGTWPTTVISNEQSETAVMEALRQGPYGRCVFHCDNNVCDHQATLIEFENGVSATFNLSAFTNQICRTIKIMGTKGMVSGNDVAGEVVYQSFVSNGFEEVKKETYRVAKVAGGHNGGDSGIMEEFIKVLQDKDHDVISSANRSLQSHLMAFAAEESRLQEGKTIYF